MELLAVKMHYYDAISEGYNQLHKEEQLKKLNLIKKYIYGRILDVGCGTFFTNEHFNDITGIDPSEGMLKQGKGKRMVGKAECLPFKDKSFDCVLSLTAIQNFDDIEKGIKEMERVSKDVIVISCLKKSEKLDKVEKLLKNYKKIEEEKDIIFLFTKH